MLEVRFKHVRDGAGTYDVVATLYVNDDGTHRSEGDVEAIPTDVIIRDPDTPGRTISFETNPQGWARNVAYAFRTPYLVAETIEHA
ncbi:MAG: hypothetical protein L0G87_00555 [Renibacterium salmoninarum]|nr:hypothetical protein [Renibacterium salmoninarum]